MLYYKCNLSVCIYLYTTDNNCMCMYEMYEWTKTSVCKQPKLHFNRNAKLALSFSETRRELSIWCVMGVKQLIHQIQSNTIIIKYKIECICYYFFYNFMCCLNMHIQCLTTDTSTACSFWRELFSLSVVFFISIFLLLSVIFVLYNCITSKTSIHRIIWYQYHMHFLVVFASKPRQPSLSVSWNRFTIFWLISARCMIMHTMSYVLLIIQV